MPNDRRSIAGLRRYPSRKRGHRLRTTGAAMSALGTTFGTKPGDATAGPPTGSATRVPRRSAPSPRTLAYRGATTTMYRESPGPARKWRGVLGVGLLFHTVAVSIV